MNWKIAFYNERVEKDLSKWSSALKARLTRILELMQEHGADLGMPLTRSMGNGLFEIRVKAGNNIGRVFFVYITDVIRINQFR